MQPGGNRTRQLPDPAWRYRNRRISQRSIHHRLRRLRSLGPVYIERTVEFGDLSHRHIRVRYGVSERPPGGRDKMRILRADRERTFLTVRGKRIAESTAF